MSVLPFFENEWMICEHCVHSVEKVGDGDRDNDDDDIDDYGTKV